MTAIFQPTFEYVEAQAPAQVVDEYSLPALLDEEKPDTWGSLALLLSLPALMWLGMTLT